MARFILVFITMLFVFSQGLNLHADIPADIINAPFIKAAPKIDGEIDELYNSFAKAQEFYQMETGWGKPASEKTIAYFGFDEKNFYFAVQCFAPGASGIRTNIERRDSFGNSDYILLFLDPFKTMRKGIFLGFNPYGIQLDGIRDDESKVGLDFSWDTLWYSKGKIYDWGYFVECRIPFKSIRFPSGTARQEWGAIVYRLVPRRGEESTSVELDPKIRGLLSQAATLVIDRRIKPGKNFEAIPTVTGLKNSEQKIKPEFGLSVKYGISSNSTVDVTYNPDFSHIEADEERIDINQRFALYYEEKRPFFLEAKEIFEMPLQLFYSRRIADPAWGLKFTGRPGNSSIGFISSKDSASFENLGDISAGGEDSAFVNVLRYRYQLKESSHLGFFISHKNWSGKRNLVLAADSFLKFMKNFAFGLMGAYTDKEGERGSALYSMLSYQGKHLITEIGYTHYSPEFDPQIGFINRTSYRSYWIYSGYNFYPQKDFMRRIKPALRFTQNFDWETNDLVDRIISFSISGQSIKNSVFSLAAEKSLEKFKGVDFEKLRFSLSYNIYLTKALSLATGFFFGDNINYEADEPYLGYSHSFLLQSDLNFLKRIGLSISYSNYYFFDAPGGNLELKKNIFRLKNTVFFTREISSRIIYEYDDYYFQHYLSLLLSYELNPGTVFYFGLSSDFLKKDGSYQGENFSIFFKFSYFLRM